MQQAQSQSRFEKVLNFLEKFHIAAAVGAVALASANIFPPAIETGMLTFSAFEIAHAGLVNAVKNHGQK